MATAKSTLPQIVLDALAIEAQEAREAGALGFMARALVQATLPHKRVPGNEFVRRNGAFALHILAPASLGLPYGSMPRLIMAWLTSTAVRTKSRQLVLGPSLAGFLRELGLPSSGGPRGYIRPVRDQMLRLFGSMISVTYQGQAGAGGMNYTVADKFELWWAPRLPEQRALWESTVNLSEQFFREITEHPVPIDIRAIRALKKSPLALDVYSWLTYRMSYLRHDVEIPWQGLAMQFGSEYGRLRAFKESFLRELRKVQTVYPEARIGIGDYGLLLRPSRPHVPPCA